MACICVSHIYETSPGPLSVNLVNDFLSIFISDLDVTSFLLGGLLKFHNDFPLSSLLTNNELFELLSSINELSEVSARLVR